MIVTDDLDEYIALKGLINYCSHAYDSDCGCGDCKLGGVCIVTIRKSPYKDFKVKYEPYYDIPKAAPRELETKTLDERKKDGDKVELTF